MKLSPRLETIANFVKKGAKVADVGTDHGYIPVFLVEKSISEKIIATDINEGPLNNAKSYINLKGLNASIETRLGNGLEVLNPGEVDTIIIAGMGGLLIRDILIASENVLNTTSNLILQPMVASEEVRRYLYTNGFTITDESLSKEGDKYYEIIVAQPGHEKVTKEIYYEIGKKLIENRDPLLKEYLNKKLNKTKKVIDSLKDETTENAKYRLKELTNKYKGYMEVIEKL